MLTMLTANGLSRLGFTKQGLKMIARSLHSPQAKRRAFATYTPTRHDVLVCTYSKSGTNWMMQIVTQIAYLGEADFENIHKIVPWPDVALPENMSGIVSPLEPTYEHSPTKLRAFKTHHEAEYVPYNPESTYIVVIRDPKDALVSGYYFADGFLPNTAKNLSPVEWAEFFQRGKTMFGSWPQHTAGWWQGRDKPNVLVLTFAEMKKDLPRAVRQVARQMKVDLSEVQQQKVVEKSSFEYMKQIDHKFNPVPARGNKVVMMRSGKQGESKTFLSLEQREKVDDAMKEELKRLGSDFPYDEMFTRS